MKKRFLLLCILCVALVCTMVACGNDEDTTIKTTEETADYVLTLSKDGGSYSVTAVKDKSKTAYTIPSNHNGKPVTSIGENAFDSCIALRELEIPEGITSIGNEAFADCTGLYSVTLPSSLKSIGDSAFDGCIKLYEVCNKSSLNIVAQDSSNGSVAANALNVCKNPQDKKISVNGSYVLYINGGTTAIVSYIGNEESLTLPSDFNGNSYYISDYAFARAKIKSVVIPSTANIGNYAFFFCQNLASVTISDGVTAIGEGAFAGCSSLTSITVPNSVSVIGKKAFAYCDKLASVTLSTALTEIADEMFVYCYKLSGIVIPEGVTSIGKDAFVSCAGITSVVNALPEVKEGEEATPFTGLVLPSTLKTIGEGAFSACNGLASVTCPSSLKAIEKNAFKDCSALSSFSFTPIPNDDEEAEPVYNIEELGEGVFYNCKKISSFTVPASVTAIGENAFYGCTSMTIKPSVSEKPEGWHDNFNPTNLPIEWVVVE